MIINAFKVPNYLYNRATCKLCPSGQYVEHENQNTELYNIRGHNEKISNFYSDMEDPSKHRTCKVCAAGKFQDETGKLSCKDCVAGQFQNEKVRQL